MATWKKIITSGSNAHLNQVTSSGINVTNLDATNIGAFTAGGAIDFNNENLTNVNIDTGDIASAVTINKSPTVNFNSGDVQGTITLTNLAGGTGGLTIQPNAVEGSMLSSNVVDNETLAISSNALVIKDGGVDSDALAADIAVTSLTSTNITASGVISGSSTSTIQVGGNITANTFVGNIDAVDGDFDGTLEADAITVAGTALADVIAGTTVTNATNAAVATTVTITDNESTNEENAITFTAGGDLDGGNLGLESDGDLKYNPSLGRLSTTQVSATHVTASGNISSSATSTGSIGLLQVDGGDFTSASLAAAIAGTGDFENFTVTADAGSDQTITNGNTLDIAGGTNITTAVGNTDTVTINLDNDIINSSLGKIGTADDQEYIDFGTSNEVNIKVNNTERLSVDNTGVVVTGNLTVNGTTTTVDTTNTQLKDQFLLLASGSSATNVDAGIIVQSGSVAGTGSAFYHDQSDERWSVAKSISSVRTEATAPTQFVTTVKTDTVNPDTTSGSYGAGEMHVNTSTGEIWIRFG